MVPCLKKTSPLRRTKITSRFCRFASLQSIDRCTNPATHLDRRVRRTESSPPKRAPAPIAERSGRALAGSGRSPSPGSGTFSFAPLCPTNLGRGTNKLVCCVSWPACAWSAGWHGAAERGKKNAKMANKVKKNDFLFI